MKLVPTHCAFCGMQCGMNLKVDAQGQVFGVEARDFPVNKGRMCPKGVVAYQQLNHPQRLTYPMMRKGGKGSPLERCTWDEALSAIVRSFRDVRAKHGQNAVSIYSGSSMTTEKTYLMGKFARVAVGTGNIDYNGRLCMVSAAYGNNKAFGVDRAANPWSDIALADVIFSAGTNTAECHPLTMPYIWEARDRGGKHIVVDPRVTPGARTADIHLQIRPGTDTALANAILHEMVKHDWLDHDFIAQRTNGFDETAALVSAYSPQKVARLCGIPAARIEEAAEIWGTAKTSFLLHARGIEHSTNGVNNVLSYINMVLASGRLGRPGCGYGTLTGQGNGQGGREHGQKADQLPGQRKYMSLRITLRRVAAMAGIEESALLHALAELGNGAISIGDEGRNPAAPSVPQSPQEPPDWMAEVAEEKLHWVDLLSIDHVLGDPMLPVNLAVRGMQPGEVIGIRHRWGPQPLYDIWQKMGIEWYSRQVRATAGAAAWHIFVHKPATFKPPPPARPISVELRHIPASEVAPRLVTTFEQLRPGESLEAWCIPGEAARILQALDARYPGAYSWEQKESTANIDVIRIHAVGGYESGPPGFEGRFGEQLEVSP